MTPLRRLRRFWPRSLAGQFTVLLLLALLASHAVAFWAFSGERRQALQALSHRQALAETVAVARALRMAPAPQWEAMAQALSTPQQRFWLTPEPAAETVAGERAPALEQRLRGMMAGPERMHMVLRPEEMAFRGGPPGRDHRDDDEDDWRGGHDADDRRRWDRDEGEHDREPPDADEPHTLLLSLELGPQRWLNARMTAPPPVPFSALPLLGGFGLAALAVSAVVVVMARRIARPLRRMAAAADRLGRGEAIDPLPERGSEEMVRVTRAFNTMRERLDRFVSDRTRMLAAISHDLRTPISALRVRAEMIEDEALRERMTATLAELQHMVEATLAFAREDAAAEPARPTDLTALVAAVCDDLADAGHAATLDEDAPRLTAVCRPHSLRRALGNVVDNAVKYGSRARVRLHQAADAIVIDVDDDGPGIPPEAAERVFQPFVRLEASRSTETGGIGLGLAIARTILRRHGGDITLANRPEGGLRATLTLPTADPAAHGTRAS